MKHILFFTVLLMVSGEGIAQKNNETPFTFKNGVTIAHWTDFLFTGRTYGDPKWFAEKDVTWMARHGFDHLLIRVSGGEISNDDLSLNKERLTVIDSAIHWCKKKGMGTIISLMSFPDVEIDSTFSESEKNEKRLESQVLFWDSLAKYLSPYDKSVRFLLSGDVASLTDDIDYLNRFNLLVTQKIRETNPLRKLHISSISTERLEETSLPPNDKNIVVTIEYNGFDIFTNQHYPGQFPENFPLIKFPGKVPDLSSLLEKNHWALPYSTNELDFNTINSVFSKVNKWRTSQKQKIEIHIPFWGYFVGMPVNPKFSEDTVSLSNYGEAFTEACRKNNINWTVYDYNSAMTIKKANGELSDLFKKVKVKKT